MRMILLFVWLASFNLLANDLILENWVRRAHSPISDLQALDAFVGDSQIFGFGESHHGLSEPNEIRNRFFARLVESKGFRAIVPESGFLEARLVERYIHGDTSLSLSEVLEKGFTHGMGEYEESRDLVEWMKHYNATHAREEDKVHFYGMDLSIRGDYPRLPLETLRPYLVKWEPEYVSSHLDPLLVLAEEASRITDQAEAGYKKIGKKFIEPNYLDGFTTISFESMSPEKQRQLEEGITQLVIGLDARRERLIALGGLAEFEWNRQVAIQAQQMLRNLRSRQKYPKITDFGKSVELLKMLYPDPIQALNINMNHLMAESGDQAVEDFKSYFKGRETRELSEAENIQWVQRLHGKVMIFAHNGHVMKDLADIVVGDLHIGKNGANCAGNFLEEMYGKDYVFMASTVNDVVDVATGEPLKEFAGIPLVSTSACKNCIERPLATLGAQVSNYFVDFRKADGEALLELNQDRETRWDFIGFQRLNLRQAYDGLLYIDRARLAVPLGKH